MSQDSPTATHRDKTANLQPPVLERLKGHGWFYVLTFLAYLALAVASTYPLITHCKSWVLGYIGFENTAQTLWIYNAWEHYQLDMLHQFAYRYGFWGSLLHLDELYRVCMSFPEHNSVSNGMDFFWTWPLKLIFGFPLYYNVKCWLVLALNGLSAALLAIAIGTKRPAAFLSGAIYAFNPFHFYQLATGRMIETQTFLPVLAITALYVAWRNPNSWLWVLAGAMLGLVTDNYWFYGHFTIVFIVFFLIYHLIARKPPCLGPCWRNLVLYLMAFLVVVLPFAHPYLIRLSIGERIPGMVRPDPGSMPSMVKLTHQMISFSAEADYPIHQASKFLDKPDSAPWWIPLQCTFLANALLLGLVPAVLLRRGWFWIAGSLFFYLLPLGPFLKYHGSIIHTFNTPTALPYLFLIQYFPLLTKLFWPNQSMYLMALCLCMLIALNVDKLFCTKKTPRWICLVAMIGIMGLGAGEMIMREQLPVPQTKLTIPPLYQKEGHGAGYIFLPVGRRYWEVSRDFNRDYYHGADLTLIDMQLAMSEGKGLFGRPHYMAGKDYWLYEPANLSSHPFLRWIIAQGVRKAPPFSQQDLNDVKREGYEYLVVSERICAHVADRGSYKVDMAEGKKIFDNLCLELKEMFGPAVYEGVEDSYDQGVKQGGVVLVPFRIAIFHMGDLKMSKGAQPTQGDKK